MTRSEDRHATPTVCNEHGTRTLRIEMGVDAAIGQQLRTLREIAGLTLEALADRTGLPAEELDDHEHGLMPVPLARAVILSESLGIDIRVLIETAAWAWRLGAGESKHNDAPGSPNSPGC
jgi:predicted transcriptional regulator